MTQPPVHECVSMHVEYAGLTKADLARKLGWKYLRVMRLLNGDTELLAEDMRAIAEVLKVDLGALYERPKKRKAS